MGNVGLGMKVNVKEKHNGNKTFEVGFYLNACLSRVEKEINYQLKEKPALRYSIQAPFLNNEKLISCKRKPASKVK